MMGLLLVASVPAQVRGMDSKRLKDAASRAQIGAKSTDYVLLIMNEDGIRSLVDDKFTHGGDAGVAAGRRAGEPANFARGSLQKTLLC